MSAKQVDPENGTVGLDKHGRKAVEEYKEIRNLYASFADCIKSILVAALNNKNIKLASIEGRAKMEESFRKKPQSLLL